MEAMTSDSSRLRTIGWKLKKKNKYEELVYCIDESWIMEEIGIEDNAFEKYWTVVASVKTAYDEFQSWGSSVGRILIHAKLPGVDGHTGRKRNPR